LLAFPIHELAHAVTADRLGDPTPRYQGHITLNPFAQLNAVGSLLMMFFGLGWAYVPITPSNLRPNPRTGHMIVAVAGPISNLILAVFTAILWYSIRAAILTIGGPDSTFYGQLHHVFLMFAYINIALFFLNLIPLAPLDGFFVLKGLLPYEMAYQLERLQQYSMLIFLAIFLLPFLTGISIIGSLIFWPAQMVVGLLFMW
jgi:Zn-dependent protease